MFPPRCTSIFSSPNRLRPDLTVFRKAVRAINIRDGLKTPNDFLTFPLHTVYEVRGEIHIAAQWRRIILGLYRTLRPIIVDARQCTHAETITTDLGFINTKQGEWVIRGESGESYVLDDAIFRRAFIPLQGDVRATTDPRAQVRSKHGDSFFFENSPLTYSDRDDLAHSRRRILRRRKFQKLGARKT